MQPPDAGWGDDLRLSRSAPSLPRIAFHLASLHSLRFKMLELASADHSAWSTVAVALSAGGLTSASLVRNRAMKRHEEDKRQNSDER